MKTIMLVCLGVVGFAVTITGLNYLAYGNYSFFAPKFESVRRDVMLQSRAYTEAEVRRLYDFKLQYARASSDDERATIAAVARHEFVVFDRGRLPPDLQMFANTLGIYN